MLARMISRFVGPRNPARSLLRRHFGDFKVDALITAGRTFPVTTRVDLQAALERQFSDRYPATPTGVHSDFVHETLSTTHLVSDGQFPVSIGPLRYDEIDVGEAMAARCLRCGLWLARSGSTLDEMLFAGGSLNLKLLGGAAE